MNKQGKGKIEYLEWTWNVVTGCLHKCPYCYAKKITNRFSNWGFGIGNRPICDCNADTGAKFGVLHILNKPYKAPFADGKKAEPYPFGFEPTFHRYRLDEPAKLKTPSIIGVVYMGDLFGVWTPDSWIQEVFKACEAAPWHKYLFLTKNGERYEQLGLLPDNKNFWYGTTRTGMNRLLECGAADRGNIFLSLEPLLTPVDKDTLNAIELWNWVIIGQQTNPSRPPKPEWVQSIIDQCRAAGVPVFVKSPLYQQFPIQEFPEGLK